MMNSSGCDVEVKMGVWRWFPVNGGLHIKDLGAVARKMTIMPAVPICAAAQPIHAAAWMVGSGWVAFSTSLVPLSPYTPIWPPIQVFWPKLAQMGLFLSRFGNPWAFNVLINLLGSRINSRMKSGPKYWNRHNLWSATPIDSIIFPILHASKCLRFTWKSHAK